MGKNSSKYLALLLASIAVINLVITINDRKKKSASTSVSYRHVGFAGYTTEKK